MEEPIDNHDFDVILQAVISNPPGCHTTSEVECYIIGDTMPEENIVEYTLPVRHCSYCARYAAPDQSMLFTEHRTYCEECIEVIVDEHTCHICQEFMVLESTVVNGNQCCLSCASEMFVRCASCLSYIEPADRVHEDYCVHCYEGEWNTRRWSTDCNTYDNVKSNFTFGVELETSQCPDYHLLDGNTVWGCAREASTSGKEFISPVLKGDQGLNEIKRFIAQHTSGWQVDRRCGTHIHIGLSEYDLEQKRKVAYAYRTAWPFFEQWLPDRAENAMCGSPQWDIPELMNSDDIDDFAGERDKFEYVNWRSLLKYNTVEIRMLYGTLDADLITNWIVWHTQFIDKVANMSWKKLEREFGEAPLFSCFNINEKIFDELNTLMGDYNGFDTTPIVRYNCTV